jgi:hypothetical protein
MVLEGVGFLRPLPREAKALDALELPIGNDRILGFSGTDSLLES